MPALDLSRAKWRKSTHSAGNGNCVEVAEVSGQVAVRDSKDSHGPALLVTAAAWQNFICATKEGTISVVGAERAAAGL
jgi:hypothetical protein